MVVCSRNKYDAMLARLAESIGVEIQTGATAKKVDVSFEKASVLFSKDGDDARVDASFAYDCPGVWIGEVDGPLNFNMRFGMTLQHEFNIGEDKMKEINPVVSVIYPKRGSYQGYGWVFPSSSSVHVGAGTTTLSHGNNLEGMIREITKDYCPYLDFERTPKIIRSQRLPYPQKHQLGWWRYGIGGDKGCLLNIQGEGNYYAQLAGAVFGWLVADHIERGEYSMCEYDEIMGPVQDSLLDSIKRFKLMMKPLVNKLVFGLAPKSYGFRRRLTNSIRDPPPIGGARDISKYTTPLNSVL